MTILIVGLVVFLGVHAVRIVADDWRTAQIARIGIWPWKGIYALLSAAGLVLVIWGYSMTRAQLELWQTPAWLRYVASALMLLSFILCVAAYVPRNRIKAAIGHPLAAGTTIWALAHLLTNGRAGDLVLFGAFLLWAVFSFRAARARDRAGGQTYPAGNPGNDAVTLIAGAAAWALFVWSLHLRLIGVPAAF